MGIDKLFVVVLSGGLLNGFCWHYWLSWSWYRKTYFDSYELFLNVENQQSFFLLVLVWMIVCVALMDVTITIFGLEFSFCFEYLIWLIEQAVKVTNGYGFFVCGCFAWRVCWLSVIGIIIISHYLDLCIISCVYSNELSDELGHHLCL